MASKLAYPYDTAAHHLAEMKRRGDYWPAVKKDRSRPPMTPRAAGSGVVRSRVYQGAGQDKNHGSESPSKRGQQRRTPELEIESEDSPSRSIHTRNEESPSSPLHTPRPLASGWSIPISFSPTPRQPPISRGGPAEWRHGVADWPWEARQQMLLLNLAHTDLPFDDPFVEGGSGIQQTDDDDKHQGQQAGSQLSLMDESTGESATLSLSNSGQRVYESEDAEESDDETKFQDVLRERNANLAKLEKASPAKASQAKRIKLWPSRAAPPVPSTLLQLRRQQIDDAAVAEGLSSQETLTTRKKRLGTGSMRKIWTRLRGKKENRSQEFEEVLQTRSERIRPMISMPVLQTTNPFVSMPTIQTTQPSLPVSSLPTTPPSVPVSSPGAHDLGNMPPVPNFSRLMSPSTPNFPTLHSPSMPNLAPGSPFVIDCK
jgi:hypothetical protein